MFDFYEIGFDFTAVLFGAVDEFKIGEVSEHDLVNGCDGLAWSSAL